MRAGPQAPQTRTKAPVPLKSQGETLQGACPGQQVTEVPREPSLSEKTEEPLQEHLQNVPSPDPCDPPAEHHVSTAAKG